MWYCAFCSECNEKDAEHCKECGAHKPVAVSLDDARKMAPDIPVRIAGLRFWVFIPALTFYIFTGLSYSQFVKAQHIVAGYRADCTNLAANAPSAICTGVPATYKILDSSGPNNIKLVDITPEHQTPFYVTANPESLQKSGKGTAIFWKGQLTSLSTSSGQIETNFSPVHLVHDQQAPIFCWFLMAFGATFFPFTRGYAFVLEPDVDDDLKPKE